MKVYTFGDQSKPVMMLFPGTCCYWKNNFGHVIEGLKEYFYVAIVSYSGFDETEHSTFISELDETKKIEQYIQEYFNGHIFAVYGCSLGGSFVSLLLSREKFISIMRLLVQVIWIKLLSFLQNYKLHL